MRTAAQAGVSLRRERLKREREDRILDAAAQVFARKGYHKATIREIAQAADVADGTIYNYFADKRDLLVAMATRLLADSVVAALAQYETSDDRSHLKAIISQQFGFLERNFPFVRALLTEVWSDEEFRLQYWGRVIAPLMSHLEDFLEARIQAGTLRPANTRVAVRAISGSFLFFLLLSLPGHGGLDADLSHDELVSELVDLFLFGLEAKR